MSEFSHRCHTMDMFTGTSPPPAWNSLPAAPPSPRWRHRRAPAHRHGAAQARHLQPHPAANTRKSWLWNHILHILCYLWHFNKLSVSLPFVLITSNRKSLSIAAKFYLTLKGYREKSWKSHTSAVVIYYLRSSVAGFLFRFVKTIYYFFPSCT